MPAALAQAVSPHPEPAATDTSAHWETPSGPVEAAAKPRHTRPAFVYRGYAEPHWRGQTCYLVSEIRTDERLVVMACGCRASVPWWTLEPIRPET
jgi:hypothetical protein